MQKNKIGRIPYIVHMDVGRGPEGGRRAVRSTGLGRVGAATSFTPPTPSAEKPPVGATPSDVIPSPGTRVSVLPCGGHVSRWGLGRDEHFTSLPYSTRNLLPSQGRICPSHGSASSHGAGPRQVPAA